MSQDFAYRRLWPVVVVAAPAFIFGGTLAAGTKGLVTGVVAAAAMVGAAWVSVRGRIRHVVPDGEVSGSLGLEGVVLEDVVLASVVSGGIPYEAPHGRPPHLRGLPSMDRGMGHGSESVENPGTTRPPTTPLRVFPKLGDTSPVSSQPWLLPKAPLAPAGMIADEARVGGLDVRAASVVGPGHRTRGLPRQDAYCLAKDSHDQFLIVAVADGMSDSDHSEIGAQVAVRTTCGLLRERLNEGAKIEDLDAEEVFLAAAQQMNAVADQRGWTGDDVRAVLGVAVVPTEPDPDGLRKVWLASLGDLAVWRRLHDGWEKLLGEGKSGFDAGRLNSFLPHTHRDARPLVATLASDAVLVLATDGVGDAFEGLGKAASWFAREWRDPLPAVRMLMDVGYEARQYNDDRTAVAIWCREGRRA